MDYTTILLFLIYSFGLGFTVTRFVRNSDNFFERNLARLGIGLSTIPLVGILLSILHIPVDWRIILLLSLAYPAFYIFRNYKSFKFNLKFKLKKSDFAIMAVLVIFFLSFFMYYGGANAYPYLEDDDPWSHAMSIKYVSVEKTFFNSNRDFHYLDPYPPVYDGLMGILHQTSSSMIWTLKFFNALIISLSLIFFYLFVKSFTHRRDIALISTVLLAMIPAYLSHFIWSHAFIPGFIFLALFSLERIRYDKKWMYLASIPIASVILTSVTQGIKFFMIFLIYFAVKSIIEKKFVKEIFIAGVLGLAVSLLWWFPLIIRYNGILGLADSLGFDLSELTFSLNFLNSIYFYLILACLLAIIVFGYSSIRKRLTLKQTNFIGVFLAIAILVSYFTVYALFIDVPGTADKIYDFNDFFIAKKTNMINNPIGVGIVIFLLLFFTLFLILYKQFSTVRKRKNEMPIFQFNLLIILIIINGVALLVSLVSYLQFQLKPGTVLKYYMVDGPEKLNFLEEANYFLSFSFNVWGVYLLIGSLILLIAIAIFLIFKGYVSKEKSWLPISLLLFVYTFAGLYNIPTTLFLFRFWMLFAFIVSIIAGYGFISLLKLGKSKGIPKVVIGAMLVILIFYTSGIQKYTVNTAQWPPGAFWTSMEEVQGYIWLKENLPPNTKVFAFVNNGPVIGMDMYTCHWCEDEKKFQRTGVNESASNIGSFLRRGGYNYFIIGGQFAREYGENITNNKINEIMSSGLFKPVYQTRGFLLFELL